MVNEDGTHKPKEESQPATSDESLQEFENRMFELVRLIKNDPEFCERFSSSMIGRYRIRSLLSDQNDGQTVVFSAIDPALNRQVVIKIGSKNAGFETEESLRREGRILCQIDVPQVVRCLAIEEDLDGTPFLVLDFVEGRNLESCWATVRADPQRMTQLLDDLCEGLQAVHGRGLLHLDLKPQNIIVTNLGTSKLVDFGLSYPISSVPIEKISGTLAFMAPEVARNETASIDHRTDVFGVGAVIYFLLTGEPLYHGQSQHELLERAKMGQITPPSERTDDVDGELEAICLKCLALNPENRFQSMDSLSSALDPWRSSRAHGDPIATRRAGWLRRTRVGLIAAVSLLGLVGWFVYSSVSNSGTGVLPIPSSAAIEDQQVRDSLPRDIDLTCVLAQKSKGEFVEVSHDENEVFQLAMGSDVQFTASSPDNCWMAVFNFEAQADADTLVRETVFPSDDSSHYFEKGDTLDITFAPTPTPAGRVEYLLLVAFSAKWDPDEIRETEVITPELIEAVKRQFRGLNQVDDKLTMKLIPYHVR